jgi:hypothetical protein
MTRLELCQAVQGLMRGATGALGTTPTTTLAQTGVEGEIVRWVDYAYRDIQNEQEEWRFRTKRGSFNTVASTRVYTVSSSVTDFDKLLPSMAQSGDRYITIYKTSEGVGSETRVWYVPYEQWQQGVFDTGSRPEGKPVRFTIEPDGQIAFDPTPDAIYTVNFDYRRTLHAMTTDADATTGTPIIPSRFHFAIVWGALMYYCLVRGDADKLEARCGREYAKVMNQMRFDQLPELSMESL